MNKKIFLLVFVAVFLISFVSAIDISNLNEEELRDVSTESLVEEINSNIDLLENEDIGNELSLRAVEDISILNENVEVKEKWFSQFGITDQGVEIGEVIVGEEKTTVKTKGEYSVTFNLEDNFLGATVKEDGSLTLTDGTEIRSSTILRDENGILNFEGGMVNLTESSRQEFNFKNSKIKIGDREFYSSNDEFNYFKLRNEEITLEGDIYERNPKTGEKVSKLYGSMKIDKSGDRFLGDETVYSTYLDDKASKIFSVDKPTMYIEDDDCVFLKECISVKGNSIKINAKENNINIKSIDESIENFKVNKIGGEGAVIFTDTNDNRLFFTKDIFSIDGNVFTLSSDIYGEFEEKGESYTLYYPKDLKSSTINGKFVGVHYSTKLHEVEGDNLIFGRHTVRKGMGEEFLEEEIIVNKLNIEGGGNLYVRRGSLDESISKYSEEGGFSYEDYLKSSQEIRQVDEDLIVPSGEKFSSKTPGQGMSYKEALADALNDATEFKRLLVRAETTYIKELSEQKGKFLHEDYFRNYIEDSSSAYIEDYEVVKIDRYESAGKWQYQVWIDVEFGELVTEKEEEEIALSQ